MTVQQDPHRARTGVLYGLAAYLWWGGVVGYFKAVAHVAPLEVLAHRVVWSLLLLAALMSVGRRWSQLRAALGSRKVSSALAVSTALVAANWFTFIWAVTHAKVVQASLGYFINPLVNVLLGTIFLRERLRPLQWLSVALAVTGVTMMTVHLHAVPSIALILAFSFGFYGLLRKTAAVDALTGLTVETMFLTPIALVYLLWLGQRGSLDFAHVDRSTDLLLVFAGVITAMPLLWFANAARRLDLATVGFLQYIAPSMQLAIGVLIFGENFTRGHGWAFAFIWVGLAIYSFDALRRRHAMRLSRRRDGAIA